MKNYLVVGAITLSVLLARIHPGMVLSEWLSLPILLVTGLFFFDWLQKLWGFSFKWAVLGVLSLVLLSENWVDPAGLLFSMMVIRAITQERDWELAMLLVLGVMYFEALILFLPLRFLWRTRLWIWTTMKPELVATAKLTLLPTFLLFLRVFAPIEGIEVAWSWKVPEMSYMSIFGIWGVLGPLALFSAGEWHTDFRMSSLSWIILLMFVGTIVTGNPATMGLAFPAVIAMALGTFSAPEQDKYHWMWWSVIFVMLISEVPFMVQFGVAIGLFVMERVTNKGVMTRE